MVMKEHFLREVKIGDVVELMIGSKEMTGQVIALDLETVRVRRENGKESVLSLDSITYYEVSEVSESLQKEKDDKSPQDVFSILKERGNTFFENIIAPVIRSYMDVARSSGSDDLNAIANSLYYAMEKNHESSPADYKIQENIKKLKRLIPGYKTAANMLGALYYHCKSDRLALDAYKQGDDNKSAFAVAQSINSVESMEHFACHHLIDDANLNAYILKWLVERMIETDDFSVISKINADVIETYKVSECLAVVKASLIANNVAYDSSLDSEETRESLRELLRIFSAEIVVSGKRMLKYFSEVVAPVVKLPKPKKVYIPKPVYISKPRTENPTFMAAKRAREKKDFERAEKLFVEAIRKSERPDAAAAELVNLMFQEHDFEKAATYLGQYGKYMREAVYKNLQIQLARLNPSYEFSQSEQAEVEQDYFLIAQKADLDEKNLQKAITYYKKAIDAGQRLSGSVPNLVSIYTRLEMYDEALALLDGIGKKHMGKTKYLNLRLTVFSAAKDGKHKDEINETYRQVISLEISAEKRVNLRIAQAYLMISIEEYEYAIKLFEQCQNKMLHEGYIAPDKAQQQKVNTLFGFSKAYSKLGNKDKAIEYAEEVLKIQPENELAKNVVSGQVNEDMKYVGDSIGVSKISGYIQQKIEKLSLETELKNKTLIKEGEFIGTPEEAENIINGIFLQVRSSVNDEIQSNNYFAIAKLIRQILDRDEEVKQTTLLNERNYQLQVAIGSYFYGEYKLYRTELTHNFDAARYCFFESIQMFRDSQKLHKCWAASTLRYIETYFYSTAGIKEGAKVYYLFRNYEKEYKDRIKKAMQRDICSSVEEFVVGMLEMLTYNSKIKEFMLESIFNSAVEGRILDVLGRIGDVDIPDSIDFDQFKEIWESSAKKYYSKRENFLRVIEETIESVFVVGQLQDNISKFDGSEFQSYLTQTDREYMEALRRIFTALLRYNEESEFDYKADTLGNADDIRKRLEEKIGDNPTYISFEKLRTMLSRLQAKIFRESAQLYGNSEPEITVKLAGECSVDESQMIVRAPIAFTNKNNVQNADNVSITISGDGVTVLNDEQRSRWLLVGGKSLEKLIEFRVTPEIIKSQAFSVNIEIQYQYKKNMTEIEDKNIEQQLPINLYSDSVFELIENKFEPYRDGGVVEDMSMFYGRGKEIEEIIRQISDKSGNILRGRCLALYGQTRTGKSSLLYHLERQLRAINEEENVIINVGSIGEQGLSGSNITDFLYTLLDVLDWEIRSKHPKLKDILIQNDIEIDAQRLLDDPENSQLYFNDVFRKINRCLEDGGHRYNIIVMIDEFTYIYDWIRRGIMTDRIMKFWKAFIQNNDVFAIIVGQDHMMKFVRESQFTNDFGSTDLRKVTYLPEEDAKKLMYEPIMFVTKEGEKVNRYQKGALDRLYELTAGSAFLIMKLCAGLVTYLNETRTVYVTRAHVNEYLKQNLSSFDEARFFEPQYDDKSNVISDEANEENKRILHKIAQLSNKKEWTQLSNVAKTDEERKIIDSLEQRDVIIVSNRDSCKIKVALYKEWIISKYGLENKNG